MIKLNNDYVIKFDTMNVMLCKKKEKTEKSKTLDDEFKVIGYFGSFEHLVDKLLKDKLLDTDYNSLEEIKNDITNFKKDILNKIIEIKPDTSPYKDEL